ncbi:Zn-dependent exopeptidase [Polychaeton citri CBS 116435]|uniref:Zn-dependent exopeptidase n=1 Tax=Polychaeton citri CBS 116435 TaxID=1314669 RepID=A0A9P4QHI8_9PEZI|nr:Zn-dependent exopeptidase [Polychaeton citri CBS 116435]
MHLLNQLTRVGLLVAHVGANIKLDQEVFGSVNNEEVFLDHESKLHLSHDLYGLHKSLTEIESISGNEKEVGEWLVANLQSQGYNVEKQIVDEEPLRFNILAWPGKVRDAKVLVSSHIDTVPPFYPYTRHNKTIAGRGSVDDKASVAAQLVAANSLISTGKLSPDDVNFLFVVGEETGGDGMRKANELDLHPQTIIFGEPTEGKLASGHKGNLGLHLKAKGKAAHSGYPWLGRSANEILVRALAALMELGPRLPSSEKFGSTTVNIGRIEGGVAGNVVAESATAQVTFRLAAGTPADAKKQITEALHLAIKSFIGKGEDLDDVCDIIFTSAGYGPIDINADVPGFESFTVNYGTDIPNLSQTVKGQKRYLYGPGTILVAHSDHEELTEAQIEGAVDGYKKIILYAAGQHVAEEYL